MLKGAIWQVRIKCWWCSGLGGRGVGGVHGARNTQIPKTHHQTIDENSNLNDFVIKMFSLSLTNMTISAIVMLFNREVVYIRVYVNILRQIYLLYISFLNLAFNILLHLTLLFLIWREIWWKSSSFKMFTVLAKFLYV